MNVNKLLYKDVEVVNKIFPKLRFAEKGKSDYWLLHGELDICDIKGVYWDTFLIEINIPITYPYCIPEVREISQIIPRTSNRHISLDGICCLDITHRLLYMAKKGIQLTDFIRNKVYSYFANQLYYDANKFYAGEEFAHNFNGVVQFYKESLNLSDSKIIISILQHILTNQLPGRNEYCSCGSKTKFKKCHSESVEFLKFLGKERIIDDLNGFLKI